MPPNILYMHSHDTGRYVSPYGYAVRTPNVQRFAEQGVLFRQAFCANPTCSPSRASLLTGQCAHSSGMLGLAHRGFHLTDYRQHIVHTLRQAGYESTLCGIQHLAQDASIIGYDRILKSQGSRAEHRASAAVKFLRHHPAEPFFLSLGFIETHRKFPEPATEDDPRYTRPPAPLPDTPQTRRDMAAFNTMAHQLDAGFGHVVDALDETGLAENTLVMITTDHGIAFPNMKCNLTDHGIGVMLMIRGPGGFAGGKVMDAMVSQIDIFPTICELLQIERPSWLQGNSMLPLIRGDAESIRDEIFAEVNFHAAHEPMRCIRTKRYKYIRRFDGRNRAVLPNCDDSPSKDEWLAQGWRPRHIAEHQLYDLAFDPHETNNVVDRAENANVLAELKQRIETWMRQTDDPILRGPLMLREGMKMNHPDQLSPGDPPEMIATSRPAP